MKLKELSWIYDYIEDETHDIDLACNAVTYLHSAPHLIDIFNITKKLFKSVATKNSIEDQQTFFYHLEKMSLLRFQTEQYLKNLKTCGERDLLKVLSVADVGTKVKVFYTFNKRIDLAEPSLDPQFLSFADNLYSWIEELIKEKKIKELSEVQDVLEILCLK